VIFAFNFILFLNHLSAQWQTFLLTNLQVSKTDPKTNMKLDLDLTQN